MSHWKVDFSWLFNKCITSLSLTNSVHAIKQRDVVTLREAGFAAVFVSSLMTISSWCGTGTLGRRADAPCCKTSPGLGAPSCTGEWFE